MDDTSTDRFKDLRDIYIELSKRLESAQTMYDCAASRNRVNSTPDELFANEFELEVARWRIHKLKTKMRQLFDKTELED